MELTNPTYDKDGFATFREQLPDDRVAYFGQRFDSFPAPDRAKVEDFLTNECFPTGAAVDLGARVVAITYKDTLEAFMSFSITKSKKNRIFAEIYNVCTANTARGKGMGKYMLETMKKFLKKTNEPVTFWLGVKMDNLKVIDFYARLGFHSPRVSNKTPAGTQVNFPFISLVYTLPEKAVTPKEVSELAKNLAMYFAYNTMAVKAFELLPADLDKIVKHVYSADKFEIGAEVDVSGTKCHIRWPTMVKGTAHFTVNLPSNYDYIFHTHPIEAYLSYGALLGSPSVLDFLDAFARRGSLVFAFEGIYCISPAPFFSAFLNYARTQNSTCYSAVMSLLKTYFSVEHWREFGDILQTNASTMALIKNHLQRTRSLDLSGISTVFEQKKLERLDKLVSYLNSLSSAKLFSFKPSGTTNLQQTIASEQKQARAGLKEFTDVDIDPVVHVQFISWSYAQLQHNLGLPVLVNAFKY